jgi:hypothetical protein
MKTKTTLVTTVCFVLMTGLVNGTDRYSHKRG